MRPVGYEVEIDPGITAGAPERTGRRSIHRRSAPPRSDRHRVERVGTRGTEQLDQIDLCGDTAITRPWVFRVAALRQTGSRLRRRGEAVPGEAELDAVVGNSSVGHEPRPAVLTCVDQRGARRRHGGCVVGQHQHGRRIGPGQHPAQHARAHRQQVGAIGDDHGVHLRIAA